ncbi:MAG TPA: hypothetical protein VL693_07875 [Vicinamibacterales bacterium]|nr:hypothetical protein [Vicinamibacterales bacterium]
MRCLSSIVALFVAGGCGSSVPSSRWWETGIPAPSSIAPAHITVLNMKLAPTGMYGGATALGTVVFDRPTADGASMNLTSSDAAAEVPSAIPVAAGASTATFTVTTRPVSEDRNATITASISEVSVAASLDVWAVLPTSFSWNSEPGDPVGGGRVDRVTPEKGFSFVGQYFRGDRLTVFINGSRGSFALVQLGLPNGAELRPGTYEGGAREFGVATRPWLEVVIDAHGCNAATGRYVVSEADFSAAGQVNRVAATFELSCQRGGPTLKGELRATGPLPLPAH